MYMFPIKPPIASEMVHVQKNLGMCSNLLLQSFQFNTNLKLQDQFEVKILWNNLSLRRKQSRNKLSRGAQTPNWPL